MTKNQDIDIGALVDGLMSLSNGDNKALDKLLSEKDFTIYQDDPVGFLEKELNMIVTDDMKELALSFRDNRITIAQSANAVGKSHEAGALSIWGYLCFPGSQVITLAAPPERNLKENLWGKIRGFARQNKTLVPEDKHKITTLKISPKKQKNSESDEFEEPCVIGITVPASGSEEEKATRVSGYHAPFQFFILDEGDGIPDGVYKGIEGCMSGKDARMLVMFNPKQQYGEAYKMIKEGRANVVVLSAFNHPNVITGEDVIPGAVDREKTVVRINEWTRPLYKNEEADSECFQLPKFLEGAVATSGSGKKYPPLPKGWRRIENPAFSYIVLGQYPAQGANQVISSEWVYAARTRWDLFIASGGREKIKKIRPTLGMDVADEGVDFNTIAPKYGSFIDEIRLWRGMDVDLSSTKAASIYAELHAERLNVESDGLGSSVAPKVGRIGYWRCNKCQKSFFDTETIKCPDCELDTERINCNSKKNIMATKSSGKCELGSFDTMRDESWWRLAEWLRRDEGAMLPPDDMLVEELLTPTYEVVGGKIKIMDSKTLRTKLGRSADRASSVVQLFFPGEGRPRARSL